MSLVEDKELTGGSETLSDAREEAMRRWQDCPASSLSHHGADCCEVARQWVLAMDYSQLAGSNPRTGPRWLRQKHTWGPSCWPMYWCEAVKQETLDCGALAALSHEVFKARGIESYPVQLIQQYTEHATDHWHKRWSGDDDGDRERRASTAATTAAAAAAAATAAAAAPSTNWIAGSLIYHEGVAVVFGDDEIKIWDSSAGWWVNPRQFGGYGAALVLRLVDARAEAPARNFRWGSHTVVANKWQEIVAPGETGTL